VEDGVIRVLVALGALVAAGLLGAIAIDVGRWQHADGRPPTLVGNVAEDLLGTRQHVALRRAVRAFQVAEATPYGFDNGATQARVRALAQGELASLGSSASGSTASQVDDLLGVLAWGSVNAPLGVVDPADRAVGSFGDAARLDPSNDDAKFNLELALRALESRGTRKGPNAGTGPKASGQHGAGAGTPGAGY
jgi:hypothetical protein